MRTTNKLYGRIIDRANVWAASREAVRGKRRRPAVAAFLADQEARIESLVRALNNDTWQPGGYRRLLLRDPKPRLIAAAPFDDRVVHHAVHRVIEPVLSRGFIDTSYACRPDRGTHRAVLRFRDGLRRFRWVGRLDMQRYFLEIRWTVLMQTIRRRIRDRACLGLLERIIASGAGLYDDPALLAALGLAGRYRPAPDKGLPIGNLSSQLFANLYLDGLDHFAKRALGVPLYLRYMDDVVFFGPTKAAVRSWREAMSAWLLEHQQLTVHADRGRATDTRGCFRFLGYVVRRDEARPAGRSVRRLKARLRAAAESARDEESAERVATEAAAAVRSLIL